MTTAVSFTALKVEQIVQRDCSLLGMRGLAAHALRSS